jgi:hypothetical protein
MLRAPVNDKIKVLLLVHRNRLLSDIIRVIGRMRNLNSPSFWAKELSQPLSTMAVQMWVMVSMLRCGVAIWRIDTD